MPPPQQRNGSTDEVVLGRLLQRIYSNGVASHGALPPSRSVLSTFRAPSPTTDALPPCAKGRMHMPVRTAPRPAVRAQRAKENRRASAKTPKRPIAHGYDCGTFCECLGLGKGGVVEGFRQMKPRSTPTTSGAGSCRIVDRSKTNKRTLDGRGAVHHLELKRDKFDGEASPPKL